MGRLFFCLRGDVDKEWTFGDSTIVRAHQHASGARIGEERAIGRSRGGPTTKIHMCADSHGNPIGFEISGGNTSDSKIAPKLIEHARGAQYFIADKGYDAHAIRQYALSKKITPVIPSRKNSKQENPWFDRHLYAARHLVENLFARLKQWHGIATRFEKLARNYKAAVYIACSMIWLKLK